MHLLSKHYWRMAPPTVQETLPEDRLLVLKLDLTKGCPIPQ